MVDFSRVLAVACLNLGKCAQRTQLGRGKGRKEGRLWRVNGPLDSGSTVGRMESRQTEQPPITGDRQSIKVAEEW